MTLTVGSAFSGAGGFDLGFHRAGFRVLWQCESDPTCRGVLARHWPDVPCHPDIRELNGKKLAKADVLVGGFPCQDLSVAGNRAGLRGERSGLFYEFARLAREVRPRLLVWENVPGLLSSDAGRDFARVLRELADGGYHGAWRVLDARHFGVAQARRRVFGVFARGRAGTEHGPEVLALADGLRRHPAAGRKAGADVARTLGSGPPGSGFRTDLDRSGAFVPAVAASLTSGGHASGVSAPGRRSEDDFNLVAFGGNDTRGPRRPAAGLNGKSTGRLDFETETFIVNAAHSCATERHARESDRARCLDGTGGFATNQGGTLALAGSSVRRLTPRECERLQGWPDDFTRYRADGTEVKDGPRYRMIGNGVAAPVAEWIARRAARVLS